MKNKNSIYYGLDKHRFPMFNTRYKSVNLEELGEVWWRMWEERKRD